MNAGIAQKERRRSDPGSSGRTTERIEEHRSTSVPRSMAVSGYYPSERSSGGGDLSAMVMEDYMDGEVVLFTSRYMSVKESMEVLNQRIDSAGKTKNNLIQFYDEQINKKKEERNQVGLFEFTKKHEIDQEIAVMEQQKRAEVSDWEEQIKRARNELQQLEKEKDGLQKKEVRYRNKEEEMKKEQQVELERVGHTEASREIAQVTKAKGNALKVIPGIQNGAENMWQLKKGKERTRELSKNAMNNIKHDVGSSGLRYLLQRMLKKIE